MERSIELLKEMQSWKLEHKVAHTIDAVSSFLYEKPDAVISFSGGKDSTVLMHIIRNVMKMNLPAIFCNTGNEFPEIVKFAKKFPNTRFIYPRMHLQQVIEKYGFPLISKEYSKMIYELRNGAPHSSRYLTGLQLDGKPSKYILPHKWRFLVDAPFSCSDKCCEHFKKNPTKQLNCITAEMASESTLREKSWLRVGCNSYGQKTGKSKPMSIWTDADVWEYKKHFNLEFCEIYDDPRVLRTGCMFCGFGASFEKISRFELISQRYPKIYQWGLKLQNSGVTYKEALKSVGVVLPGEVGYQFNIFSQFSLVD